MSKRIIDVVSYAIAAFIIFLCFTGGSWIRWFKSSGDDDGKPFLRIHTPPWEEWHSGRVVGVHGYFVKLVPVDQEDCIGKKGFIPITRYTEIDLTHHKIADIRIGDKIRYKRDTNHVTEVERWVE